MRGPIASAQTAPFPLLAPPGERIEVGVLRLSPYARAGRRMNAIIATAPRHMTENVVNAGA